MNNAIDAVLFIVLCATPIGIMVVLLHCWLKDAKAYEKELKEYLDRSVEDGQNSARAKGMGTLQSYRGRKLPLEKPINEKK